jgi:uncharacterized protein (DUF934 family)
MQMREIIKDKAVVNDDWTVLRLNKEESPETFVVPSGKFLIPLKVWLAQQQTLQDCHPLGIWLGSDENPAALKDVITKFSVIAVDFPKFTDGRGYSIAYQLRSQLGYTGELRAIGDVLRDQLFYMQRVGFNAFEVRAERNIHDALKGLSDFSQTYQTAWDQKFPLFRRTQRGEKAA